MIKRLCVFCGSARGTQEIYAASAQQMGRAIARRGWELVYGGGKVGLMGIVADAAMSAGGKVIGVIPQALLAREVGHGALTQLHVVSSMHERKAMMADLSDGFVALPGGFGTFEEFCEVLTWSQLGIHNKPCGVLNVNAYYDRLLAMFDHAKEEGFLRATHHSLVLQATQVDELLDRMESYEPPDTVRWLAEEER